MFVRRKMDNMSLNTPRTLLLEEEVSFWGCNFDIHGIMATTSLEVIGLSCILAPTQEEIKEVVNVVMTSFVQAQLMPMLEPMLSVIGGSQARNPMLQTPSQDRAVEEDHGDEY
ncbi:hypothetical protein E2542_SST16453 [Spatholobus suberectus]|nr:hypothetical protein E2542_SST16453 [Spatholobus suberectus]